MELSDKKVQELKDKKASIEDLYEKYFYTQQEGINVENILKLLNENICSFQDIVDKFKSMKDFRNEPCLYKLLDNKKVFKELIQNNKLNTEDLRYSLNRIDEWYELYALHENTTLLKHIIDNVSLKELVDKFKSIKDEDGGSCLHKLLDNCDNFKHLIEGGKLTNDDLRYLLNRLDHRYELYALCHNTSLIKKILNEFVLNKEDVDKFNRIIENDEECKTGNIHTIFELIEYRNKRKRNDEELSDLNELNKYVCSFNLNEDQRLELAGILKDSEVAQNTLMQIVDNNLEDQYDFESLKNLLIKDDKKNLKTKFNF